MSASTIRGVSWNAKNALVVVRAFTCQSTATSVRSAFFAAHLRQEVSFIAFVVTGSSDIVRRSHPPQSGQGSRHLFVRRRSGLAAHRGHRSHFRVRLRARLGHSRQGQGADAACRRSGSAKRATSCRTTCARRGRKTIRRPRAPTPTRSAAAPCWCARPSPFPSNAWRAATCPGSGWKEYQQSGSVCGIKLPAGLRESDRLPGADFHAGDQGRHRPRREHQRGRGRRIVGRDAIERLRQLTLRLYSRGAAHAEHRGIIVADTKFEFGRVIDGPKRATSS